MNALFLVEVLSQVAPAPTVQLDLGKLILTTVGTVLSVLATAVIFFVKRLIQSFDLFKGEVRGKMDEMQEDLSTHSEHVDGQLAAIGSQMQKVTQEMFGPNGDNGMRGDLRRSKRLLVKHDRLLVELATREGIKVDLSAEED
jgi:hypothetical protein